MNTIAGDQTVPGPSAGRREWIGLAMLSLPALLISMDLSVLHLAAPQIKRRSGAQ